MSCSYTQRSSGQGCVTPWKVRQSITAPFTELTQTSIQTHLDHRIMWSQMFFFTQILYYKVNKHQQINTFHKRASKKNFPDSFPFPKHMFSLTLACTEFSAAASEVYMCRDICFHDRLHLKGMVFRGNKKT